MASDNDRVDWHQASEPSMTITSITGTSQLKATRTW